MAEYSTIREILDSTGMYTGLTMGSSMWPLIHQQRDNIIIVKPEERLKRYDVGLYVTKAGKYVMHRVVEVHSDHYIFTGDNLLAREYVTDDMICGKLVGFYKDGKKYVDCENDKSYKLYSKIWVALKPIRPAIMFVHRGFNFIRRKVLKVK